ncbi:MAG: hypothetical protein CSA34_02845 [Desulfobulbus propionicus]|nr:MAG: hypothetical protein CSA34_02845 [Desulfobulbus propionicus]
MHGNSVRVRRWLYSFLLMTGLFFIPDGQAQQLDAAFGVDGRIAVDLGPLSDRAHAVVVQPDGKIIVAGSSQTNANLDFALIRFNADGTLDTSFNRDGTVTTPVGSGDDEILAVALLDDGGIIAAGYTENGQDRDFALVRYLSDGSLDDSFGTDGIVVTSVGNRHEEITSLLVEDDNAVLVAGVVEGTSSHVMALGRYLVDGSLDPGFADDGLALVGLGGDVLAQGIGVQTNGRIVVAGAYGGETLPKLMLAGFTRQGELDDTFGTDGIAVPSAQERGSEGYAVYVDENDELFVAGSVGTPSEKDAALFRFTRDGAPEVEFGDNGVLIKEVGNGDDVLFSLTASGESLVASGYTTDDKSRRFLLLTYTEGAVPRVAGETNPNVGQLGVQKPSTTLAVGNLQIENSMSAYAPDVQEHTPGKRAGQAGSVTVTDFGGADAVSYALAPIEENRIVAVGTSTGAGKESSMAVAVYKNTEKAVKASESSPLVAKNGIEGQSSSCLRTKEVSNITRTGAFSGGEVYACLSGVVKRGVVFSIAPDPVYKEVSGGSDDLKLAANITASAVASTTSLPKRVPSWMKPVSALGEFFLPDAIADDDSIGAEDVFNTKADDENYREEGYTEDGKGLGCYSSIIKKLRPGTTYYIRAYAIVGNSGDAQVYYGNEISMRTADACFVATAAFGSLFHPQVRLLRDFRDRFLLSGDLGSRFVDFYYQTSPPVAEYIANNPLLRGLVRVLLMPLIGLSWLCLHAGYFFVGFGGVMTVCIWSVRRRMAGMESGPSLS